MLVALVALSVALGGSASALVITGRSIKNNSVTSADLRNSTVRGKDVRDGSLRARDFKASRLPTGPVGPRGPMGPAGADGSPGIAGRERVRGVSAFDSGSTKAAFAECPPGKLVIGTGFSLSAGSDASFDDLVVTSAKPFNDTQVRVSAREAEPVSGDWSVSAEAICVVVSP